MRAFWDYTLSATIRKMATINYSIIIPHKNIPELLVRCLGSIPQRDDIQVIVVDDNSDEAESYLKKYPELSRASIKTIFTKEGKGAGYARNVGLKHITGKWVLFADADDVFMPGWTNITDQYLGSGADVIQFGIDGDSSRPDCLWHNKAVNEYKTGRKSASEVLFSISTCWAKMLSADFLRKNEILFEEVKCANDVLFGYQVAIYTQKVDISQSAIYCVCYRDGSLTTIKDKEYAWIRYNTVKRARALAVQHGFQHYEQPYTIEALPSWRRLGIIPFLSFVWRERHEIKRASKVVTEHRLFNYRHPYLYVWLVLLKLV